jgi:hypothetical protein
VLAQIDDVDYLGTPEHWSELARRWRLAGVGGLDTEYHGVPDDKSPVGRSRIHVWSVALPTERDSPLGFRVARGWCLPAAALEHAPLRAVLEDSSIAKAVHNQSVDHHALRNHGVDLRGAINTLGLIRWVAPGIINQPGRFRLKALMPSLLGRPPVATFQEVVKYERQVELRWFRPTERLVCSCGVPGCRKRKGHARIVEFDTEEVVKLKTERGEYDLSAIVPGHERWDLLVRYSLEDAVAAMNLLDLCEIRNEDPAPFPYGGARPGFNQGVEEAVIAMESVGFDVDTAWCRETAERGRGDEEATLRKLFAWYVRNAPTWGPHRREDVDPIWSSPVQKIRLFDALGFPRSPIWSKGRVKRGEVKMDHAAMKWIADNHPPAKQLCDLLLLLQRIRSGLKYLEKLRDSGGTVHPICGPAGDEDERAGAVTGRLGVKGELEAQQLPKEGEKDLYGIRKAIIA